jgi:hypothetical protein
MGQKFCTVCGTALSEGIKFCESCGTPVDQESPARDIQTIAPTGQMPVTPPSPPLSGSAGKLPVKIIAGIVIVLLIAAVAVFVVFPKIGGEKTMLGSLPGFGIKPTMTSVVQTSIPTMVTTTVMPTPTPDPFPNALLLKDGFPFGENTDPTKDTTSEGTIYRVWINDTYTWHNDMDNAYYVQKPKPGNKYLFVFINAFNKGNLRVWPPTSDNIKIHYNGQVYSPDPTHFLPDKAKDLKEIPVEVKEVQYFSKLFGTEYVEDYGFSHGTQSSYLYPGKSNAIDGYLIFEVPSSLTPDKAYAEIAFVGDKGNVWKLG